MEKTIDTGPGSGIIGKSLLGPEISPPIDQSESIRLHSGPSFQKLLEPYHKQGWSRWQPTPWEWAVCQVSLRERNELG